MGIVMIFMGLGKVAEYSSTWNLIDAHRREGPLPPQGKHDENLGILESWG